MSCNAVDGYCGGRHMDLAMGDRVGLYGHGPTAYYVLRVADYLLIEVATGPARLAGLAASEAR